MKEDLQDWLEEASDLTDWKQFSGDLDEDAPGNDEALQRFEEWKRLLYACRERIEACLSSDDPSQQEAIVRITRGVDLRNDRVQEMIEDLLQKGEIEDEDVEEAMDMQHTEDRLLVGSMMTWNAGLWHFLQKDMKDLQEPLSLLYEILLLATETRDYLRELEGEEDWLDDDA